MIFNNIANLIISDIQDKIDISVYFKIDSGEDDILKVKRSLESLAEVKAVEYISKDRALELFKSQHQADDTVSQALKQLDANPLSASLNIKARELKDYAVIDVYLKKDAFSPIVDKISYAQNSTIIERMERIKSAVEQGGWGLIIVITLITSLIIFNTIRLAIYSSREELGIMRLVGASNFFIRGPYMLEGILYGIIGSILSLAVLTIAVYYLSPYLRYFILGINGWEYYVSNLFRFAVYVTIFGVVLGVGSSYVAVRKYLKI